MIVTNKPNKKLFLIVPLLIIVGFVPVLANAGDTLPNTLDKQTDKLIIAQVNNIYSLIESQSKKSNQTYVNMEALISGQNQHIKNVEILIDTQ